MLLAAVAAALLRTSGAILEREDVLWTQRATAFRRRNLERDRGRRIDSTAQRFFSCQGDMATVRLGEAPLTHYTTSRPPRPWSFLACFVGPVIGRNAGATKPGEAPQTKKQTAKLPGILELTMNFFAQADPTVAPAFRESTPKEKSCPTPRRTGGGLELIAAPR